MGVWGQPPDPLVSPDPDSIVLLVAQITKDTVEIICHCSICARVTQQSREMLIKSTLPGYHWQVEQICLNWKVSDPDPDYVVYTAKDQPCD